MNGFWIETNGVRVLLWLAVVYQHTALGGLPDPGAVLWVRWLPNRLQPRGVG